MHEYNSRNVLDYERIHVWRGFSSVQLFKVCATALKNLNNRICKKTAARLISNARYIYQSSQRTRIECEVVF